MTIFTFFDRTLRIDLFCFLRLDLDVLYQGSTKGMYNIFCDKGVLRSTLFREPTGQLFQDIQFHRFGEDGAEEKISHAPAPETLLALVGNQRYLYYAEETQVPWSTLSFFNRYRFFRFDFLNRKTRELDLSDWAP